MSPLAHLSGYFGWMRSVRTELSRVSRASFWIAVLATVVSRISYVIAFLIPIKVILLLGSEGVPHYFQSFIFLDTKLYWVVALSVGAVAFYAMSLAADAIATRQAGIGGQLIVKETEELSTFQNQWDRASDYITRICKSHADLIVACLFLAIGIVINASLFAFLSCCLLLQCVTSLWLANTEEPNRLGTIVREELQTYLSTLTSIDFLLVFAFLLATFYFGDGTNTFVAIVSVVVARQILGSASSVASDAQFFAKHRHTINILLFPDHYHQPAPTQNTARFTDVFEPETHVATVAETLGVSEQDVQLTWRDTGDRFLFAFDVLIAQNGMTERYLSQAHAPQNAAAARNETVLFSLMEPAALSTLPIEAEYQIDDYLCRLIRLPPSLMNIPTEMQKWLRRNTLLQHWDVRPSQALVHQFQRSRLLLHERLTTEYLADLELALGSDDLKQIYAGLQAELPTMLERLKDLPLFVYNPRINLENTWIDDGDRYVTVNWGQWSLEPVGAGLTSPAHHSRFLGEAAQVLASSGLTVSEADLVLSSHLWELERRMILQRYGSALTIAKALLDFEVDTPREATTGIRHLKTS